MVVQLSVNAIAVDSEDLGPFEFTQFESDGTPWEEFMRLNKNRTNSNGLKTQTPADGGNNTGFGYGFDRANPTNKYSLGYNSKEWSTTTETGYGSQLFGPFASGTDSGE